MSISTLLDRARSLAQSGHLRSEIMRDTKLDYETVKAIVDAVRCPTVRKPDVRCGKTPDLFGDMK